MFEASIIFPIEVEFFIKYYATKKHGKKSIKKHIHSK